MQLSIDDLPMFFGPEHHALAARLRELAPAIARVERVAGAEAARDAAAVAALAEAGLFAHVAPLGGQVDARALCLCREMLGYVSPRADSIFAVQGLGVHPLLLAGSEAQRAQVPAFAAGARIAAFALTEPEAGSDVAAIATSARADGQGYVLDGEKLFISNLGVAGVATVFAQVRGETSPGGRTLTAFWVPLDAPGITVTAQTAIAPHPIGALTLRGVRVPSEARVGQVGDGFSLALRTLDAFRVSVGAAAVGMARRAMDEALCHVTSRVQFGKPLAEQPLVAAHLADCAVDLDAARLLVLRAAHAKDAGAGRSATSAVSIAKLGATEAAQRIIDRAVQLFGGRGVMAGAVVETLYRAIRPLRIYEGTSEIQRTIIGRALVAGPLPDLASLRGEGGVAPPSDGSG
ncbi:MAG: acyl-CoA dehydrogenase [Myxococcales bacterium]|nr:acyl-CoA dehydrogenase [Myxococcales bacterium]